MTVEKASKTVEEAAEVDATIEKETATEPETEETPEEEEGAALVVDQLRKIAAGIATWTTRKGIEANHAVTEWLGAHPDNIFYAMSAKTSETGKAIKTWVDENPRAFLEQKTSETNFEGIRELAKKLEDNFIEAVDNSPLGVDTETVMVENTEEPPLSLGEKAIEASEALKAWVAENPGAFLESKGAEIRALLATQGEERDEDAPVEVEAEAEEEEEREEESVATAEKPKEAEETVEESSGRKVSDASDDWEKPESPQKSDAAEDWEEV